MLSSPVPSDTDSVAVFSTQLGWMVISMRGPTLVRLSFGHRSATVHCDHATNDLVDRLTAYAAGASDDFLDVAVETSHLTPFARSIVEAVRRIPMGETRSYANVAAAAGRPRAARAVGQVMAQNRTPLVVPCHRVVASGGRLGGFSAIDGLAMKRRLLKLESLCRVAAR